MVISFPVASVILRPGAFICEDRLSWIIFSPKGSRIGGV